MQSDLDNYIDSAVGYTTAIDEAFPVARITMSQEVRAAIDLFLTPLRDIIDRSTIAAQNAYEDDNPAMHDAALGLLREGERAIRRIEPLCNKLAQQYGLAAVAAIKDDETVGKYHLILTDLLWEFDDYITVDGFNAAKYTELQGQCRQIAPKMYSTLFNMTLELPSRQRMANYGLSAPPSPPLCPLPPVPGSPPPWSRVQGIDSQVITQTSGGSNASGSDRGSRASCSSEYSYKSSLRSEPSATTHTIDPIYEKNREKYNNNSSKSLKSTMSGAAAPNQADGLAGHHAKWSEDLRRSSSTKSSAFHRVSTLDMIDEWPLVMRPKGSSQPNYPVRNNGNHEPAAKDQPRIQWQEDVRNTNSPLPETLYPIDKSSSFHLYKGLCNGAKEVLKGNTGVKLLHKPVHRTLSRVVAKCTDCRLEFDNSLVEADQTNEDTANMTKSNIGYRLRFLQKSHLPTKQANEPIYTCLFCIHLGHTLDESDATVFFSADALFSHLARHPRPLAPVPGVIVLDGHVNPSGLGNDHDIHFKTPPKMHPVHRSHTEIEGRPTGIARKQNTPKDKQQNVYDRVEELQIAEGGRITGIKWPPKYKGRRIFAWHDGVFASLPADIIMLNAPEMTALLGAKSQVRATSKWKFAPKYKDGEAWLKLDKNEIITNIGWEHPEHWCWSGMNSRGQWGIFPQAFIDPMTLQGAAADIL